MEITYTKKDLKEMIEKYYYENSGRKVSVSIEAKKEVVGLWESVECITTISISEEVTLMGMKTTVKETMSKEELTRIFNELLEKEGYSLESLEYESGIKNETVGYFMNETTVKKAYFNGIRLNISKNNVKKFTL